MSTRRFKQVDVFTTKPFWGNAVAVVLDAEGLSPEEMQRIAAWTNLSETTFVLPPTSPEADYRLRIFTPRVELPFAGHPTVGSAHAVLESGIVRPESSAMVQECGSGLLPIRVEKDSGERRIFVKAPQAKASSVEKTYTERIVKALTAKLAPDSAPLLVDVVPVWLVAELEDAGEIHTLEPDMAAISRLSSELSVTGMTVFALTHTQPYAVYTRSFAPADNIPEDPVCGSGNASVAAFLAHFDKLRLTGYDYIANQGLELGRNGVIYVRVNKTDLSIEIGGSSITCIEGFLQDRAY